MEVSVARRLVQDSRSWIPCDIEGIVAEVSLHEGLGGETPARVAKVRVGFKNWTDIVRLGV